MLKSDLCDFSDAYIVVNRTITVLGKYLLLMILWILLKMEEQQLLLLLILQMMQHLMEKWLLKTIHYLSTEL